MRHALFILTLALAQLAGACAAVAGAAEHPWQGKRIYYVTHYLGRLQEKGFFTRHAGSYQREPCVVTEEEKFLFSENDSSNPVQAVRIRTLTTPEGAALQRHESVLLGAAGQETITILDGVARTEAGGSFGGGGTMEVPGGLLFEVTGEWLAGLRSLRAGRTYSASVLDRMSRSVVEIQVNIIDRLSRGNFTVPDVWLAELSVEGRPPYQVRFTSDGRLLRLDSIGMVYHVVEREDYELGRIPGGSADAAALAAGGSGLDGGGAAAGADANAIAGGVAVSAVGDVSAPLADGVPAWDTFARLAVQADPAYEWTNALTESEYSRIEFGGSSAIITALRNAPTVDAAATFPMAAPAELQPFLTTTQTIPATHPAIIDAAYAAVLDSETRREETNIVRAISYVAGWINQTVALEEWKGYAASAALDALTSKSGDALAQARLFAAMARSLGVPTRICQGFLAETGRAALHFWSEAWVAGSWIPVDTTVSRVGLPAGYVLAERSGGDGVLANDFAAFLRTPGLRLRLLSAGRETPDGEIAELMTGDRRTYASSRGDWMANLYWGFALRLPRAWIGRVKLDSVEMTSPDRRASVKCEAMAGRYRAGPDELQANIASLQASLPRFRLLDERVVSFDPDGATPALFIDFGCVQDGVSLRCRQYVVPRRQRALRISFWAPEAAFMNYVADFDSIVASFEF